MKFLERYLLCFVLLAATCAIALTSFVSRQPQPNRSWLTDSRYLESNSVLLNNAGAAIPFTDLEDRKIAAVSLGFKFSDQNDSILNKYAEVKSFRVENAVDKNALNVLIDRLKYHNTIIVNVTDRLLGDAAIQGFISQLETARQVVLVVYGNVSSLQFAGKFNGPVLWLPVESANAASFAAQAVFGGVAVKGKLSQNVSPAFIAGTGYQTTVTRLKYTLPDEISLDGAALEADIDKIAKEAIAQRATPGAVVMVVKDGNVIFEKSYGAHTYDKSRLTNVDDIYDLASVTKISATTIAAMRLYEQEKLKLDTNVGAYIPRARQTNKNGLQIKELLLHQAGLVPFIPFYQKLKPEDHSSDSSTAYPLKVADGYYLRANYFEEVMWPQMLGSTITARGRYNYSDLSMYFMKDIIEYLTAERLDKYVQDEFYAPLGMHTAGFNPRLRFNRTKIVPTENDNYFRKTLVQGYVHDQGASMAGGVSGHAGLFARANDMAILFQMFLNGGTYGGKRYFNQSTIDLFTKQYSDVSRRGLGFDRWDPDRSNRYPSDLASPKTYGHTGYTGTCVWIDPEYNLIYIFLSNRVYPSVSNKLSSMRIRPRIQDAVYKAIKKASGRQPQP